MNEVSELVELKPCPFCGGEAQPALTQGGGIEWAQVECVERDCGAVGPTPATEAQAIAAWNKRLSLPPRVEAMLERRRVVHWLRGAVASNKRLRDFYRDKKQDNPGGARAEQLITHHGYHAQALEGAADEIEDGEHLNAISAMPGE